MIWQGVKHWAMRIALTLAAGLLLAASCNIALKAPPKTGSAAESAAPANKPTQPSPPPAGAGGQPEALKLEPSSGPPVLVWAVPPVKAGLDALGPGFARVHDGGWNVVYLDRQDMLKGFDSAQPAPQVLVFADTDTGNELRAKGRIEEPTLRTFAGDTLVIVCRAGESWATATVFDLWELRFTKFGLGDKEATTAGYYGYQALVSDGAYKRIAERVTEFPSQDALLEALLNVEDSKALENQRGAVQLAIVTASTAATTKGLKAILAIPGDLHEPLRYQAAAVKGHAKDPGVENLLRLIAEDPVAQATLQGYGYLGRTAALELK